MCYEQDLKPTNLTWPSGNQALKDALILEATVTEKIRGVIKVCEDVNGVNDYHVRK